MSLHRYNTVMRYTSVAIPDDAYTVSEASKYLDVSVTQIHRLMDDGTLERRDVEGCPILVTAASVSAYQDRRAKPGDRRLIVIVKQGFLTPRQVAEFAGVEVSVVHARCHGIETADGFRVFDQDEASVLRMRVAAS